MSKTTIGRIAGLPLAAMGAAFLCFTGQAAASTVTTTYAGVTYSGGDHSGAVAEEDTNVDADSSAMHQQNLDYSSSVSRLNLLAYQTDTGLSRAKVEADLWDGEEPGLVSATTLYDLVVTNDAGSAQSFTYDYSVSGLSLDIAEYYGFNPSTVDPFDNPGQETNGVGVRYTILVDGTQEFQASALMYGAGGTYNFDLDNITGDMTVKDPNSCYCNGASGALGNFSGAIDLGVLDIGEQVAVTIIMEAFGAGYGYETHLEAIIGDPNNLSGELIASPPPSEVPLPAALPLFLLGLAGFGAAARRKGDTA